LKLICFLHVDDNRTDYGISLPVDKSDKAEFIQRENDPRESLESYLNSLYLDVRNTLPKRVGNTYGVDLIQDVIGIHYLCSELKKI